tara:strand:- start:2751 stop:4088 length:1338 start_codon:yes stop_codon:yes gene_type:complete
MPDTVASLYEQLFPTVTLSTIALDTRASVSNSGTQGTTMTLTITIGTGSNRALFVCVNTDPSVAVSHIKLDGIAFTEISGTVLTTVGRNSIWYLMSPASGAGTITITWGASAGYVGMSAISFTGVDQTTPVNTENIVASSNTTTGASTVSITPENIGSALLGYLIQMRGMSANSGTGNFGSSFVPDGETSGTYPAAGYSQYDVSPTIGSANNLLVYTAAGERQDRVIIEINRAVDGLGKQRMVETFTGAGLDTDKWSLLWDTGSASYAFASEEDGGLKITASAGDNADAALGSATSGWAGFNVRQFNSKGSVYLDVFKHNTDYTSAKSICHGMTERARGDNAGNNSVLWHTDSRVNNKFRARTCNSVGGQSTNSDSSVVSDLNWHNYKIECKSLTVEYSIDNVIELTHTGTDVPSGGLAPNSGIQGNGNATSPSYSIKYVECYNT